MEIEFKYAVPSPEVLDTLFTDAALNALRDGAFRTVRMDAEYFDTPARTLRASGISLRARRENGDPVVTVKYPAAQAGTDALKRREEAEVPAATPAEAMPLLRPLLPARLFALLDAAVPLLMRTAGLRYTRRTALLRLPDGVTSCHLCLDAGTFGSEPFFELEMELAEGDVHALTALAEETSARYALKPQPLSKMARALSAADTRR